MSGGLEGGRTAVIADLGPTIPEISLQSFLANFLPSLNSDVGRVIKSLEEEKLIRNGRWAVFPIDPARSRTKEDNTFKPLQGLIQDIIKCSESSSVVDFAQNPHCKPWSERTNHTRPDGYFILDGTSPDPVPTASIKGKGKGKAKSSESLIKWDEIALSAELTKKSVADARNDNVRKILWSMQHIMRSDFCRRFTFGFTIENTEMRIWFCCRSMVVVTEPFNFIEDHKSLVTFVLAVSSATQVQLGWDPTVIRSYDEGRALYDITVRCGRDNEQIYRTSQTLSDHSADALRGRGTRVFKAHLLDPDGNKTGDPVAIKDVWLDIDRDREGDIMRTIYKSVSQEDRVILQDYLLTVECDGDVFVNGKLDQTPDQNALGSIAAFDLRKASLVPPRRLTPSVGLPPSIHIRARPEKSRVYPSKVHYRIVFKEVGTSLYSTRSLPDVFQSLHDVIIALEILHKYSWVHRDISPGNIFYNGHGRISDFEYAQKMNTSDGPEVLTGTVDFMSVEVECQEYMFRRREPFDLTARSISAISLPKPTIFHYNPLHDIESTWWVGVWTITCNGLIEDKRPIKDVEEQKVLARQYFPQTIQSTSRTRLFTTDETFTSLLPCLPKAFNDVALTLEFGRQALLASYFQAEAKPEIDSEAVHAIHALMKFCFGEGIKRSGQIQLCYLDELILSLKGDDGLNDTANTSPPSLGVGLKSDMLPPPPPSLPPPSHSPPPAPVPPDPNLWPSLAPTSQRGTKRKRTSSPRQPS